MCRLDLRCLRHCQGLCAALPMLALCTTCSLLGDEPSGPLHAVWNPHSYPVVDYQGHQQARQRLLSWTGHLACCVRGAMLCRGHSCTRTRRPCRCVPRRLQPLRSAARRPPAGCRTAAPWPSAGRPPGSPPPGPGSCIRLWVGGEYLLDLRLLRCCKHGLLVVSWAAASATMVTGKAHCTTRVHLCCSSGPGHQVQPSNCASQHQPHPRLACHAILKCLERTWLC